MDAVLRVFWSWDKRLLMVQTVQFERQIAPTSAKTN